MAAGLTDEELLAEAGLTDEQLFGGGGGAAAQPLVLRGREREAAQSLRVWDMALPGFSDEAMGGLSYLGTLASSGGDTAAAAKAYDDEVAYARDLKDRYAAQTDTTWGDVGAIGLGLVAGAPAAGAAYTGLRGLARIPTAGKAAQTVLGRAGQSLVGLTGTGAGYATVQQMGDATGGIGDRVSNIGIEAPLLGAGLGVAAGAAGGAVAGAARGVGNIVRGFVAPQRQAARYVGEKLADAGVTPQQLGDDWERAARTGKPVVLADVGPPGVQDAASSAARAPGPGRDFAQGILNERQAGQAGRVADDLATAAGNPKSYTQTADDIAAAQQSRGKPLYDEAFRNPAPVTGPRIVEIMGRPSGQTAINRGLQIARNEGIPENELVIRDADGNITGYTLKGLHYAKLAIDDMIEEARRSGNNTAARALDMLRRDLLGEMDAASPAYRAARREWAGHAASREALDNGRAAVTQHPDVIRRDMSRLSPAEREMYKTGYVQRIIEIVEGHPDAGNAVNRIVGNPAARARLEAVLGPDGYARLMERLDIESKMYQTYRRANLGSETAQRVAADRDIDNYVLGQSPTVAQGFYQAWVHGNLVPLWRALGGEGIANLLRGLPQRVRAEISYLLFSGDPVKVRAGLKLIAKEYNSVLAARARTDAVIGSMAASDDTRTNVGVPVATAVPGSGYLTPQPYALPVDAY